MVKVAGPKALLGYLELLTKCKFGENLSLSIFTDKARLVYGATDAVIHIAEEMPRPRIQVPIVMNSCILIGACTVFPLAAVLMYSMTDIEAVSAAALPCVELLFQATGSKPVTTFLMCWAILAYISAVCAAWVAGGRLAWAFARDVSIHHPHGV